MFYPYQSYFNPPGRSYSIDLLIPLFQYLTGCKNSINTDFVDIKYQTF